MNREKARDYAVIAFVAGKVVYVVLRLLAVRRRRRALRKQWECLTAV